MCGGTDSSLCLRSLRYGLSPRVRGNPKGKLSKIGSAGSIPACAGEPAPPPTTGTTARSIPACAGEPFAPSVPPTSLRTVYPRVCGGTSVCTTRARKLCGLSPRVRGNHEIVQMQVAPMRSIPACAGNRHRPIQVPVMLRSIPACAGEPLSALSILWQRQRSIPACAGEPRAAVSPFEWFVSGVYPRVCGGTS